MNIPSKGIWKVGPNQKVTMKALPGIGYMMKSTSDSECTGGGRNWFIGYANVKKSYTILSSSSNQCCGPLIPPSQMSLSLVWMLEHHQARAMPQSLRWGPRHWKYRRDTQRVLECWAQCSNIPSLTKPHWNLFHHFPDQETDQAWPSSSWMAYSKGRKMECPSCLAQKPWWSRRGRMKTKHKTTRYSESLTWTRVGQGISSCCEISPEIQKTYPCRPYTERMSSRKL